MNKQNISNQKILVTGGAGFIGGHLVDKLVEGGAQVIVVDNISTGVGENINPRAKFYKLNIADPKIERIMEAERPDIIYHLAFFVLVPKSVKNPLADMHSVIGSLRLLQKAKELGVKKIVFGSSGFLYGNTPNLPAKETEPISPVTPYVVSKYAIEQYLRFYQMTYGLPYVILRFAAIYGPRQRTGAMADYIRKLAVGKQADIWGDGTKTRDFVYIDDVVRAAVAALNLPDNCPDPVFNIGTGKETMLNEMYTKIANILGKEARPIYHTDRPGEQMRYCLDNTKAKEVLGWKPQVDFDEGLKRRVEYYLQHEHKK